MKNILILITVFFLTIFSLWMFFAYKAQPLILLFWGEDIAQMMYAEEIDWMQGKSAGEIEDRFGPFDFDSGFGQEVGYFLEDDRFLVCNTPAPEVRAIGDECIISNRKGVFSLLKNFPKPWMLSNLCASLLVCGGSCTVSAFSLIRKKRKSSPNP